MVGNLLHFSLLARQNLLSSPLKKWITHITYQTRTIEWCYNINSAGFGQHSQAILDVSPRSCACSYRMPICFRLHHLIGRVMAILTTCGWLMLIQNVYVESTWWRYASMSIDLSWDLSRGWTPACWLSLQAVKTQVPTSQTQHGIHIFFIYWRRFNVFPDCHGREVGAVQSLPWAL